MLSQVGYLCLGSIFVWVIIELIVQFGVRNAPNAVANQIPLGVSLGTFVNVRRAHAQKSKGLGPAPSKSNPLSTPSPPHSPHPPPPPAPFPPPPPPPPTRPPASSTARTSARAARTGARRSPTLSC